MQEIIINKDKDNMKTVAIIEEGRMLEHYQEKEDQNRLEGNIYIGKIQNVIQGMQAAFVDVGTDKNSFIHLKDILPKKDITKEGLDLETEKNIKEVIKLGDPILVQVKRDSTNKKGARVSTHISLVSRYFVLMPETEIITISQKIENEDERSRLLKIVKKEICDNHGIIIRTSSEEKTEKELVDSLKQLINRWNKIKEKYEQSQKKCPELIEREYGLIKKTINDTIDKGIDRITTNDKNTYDEVEDMIKELNSEKEIEIKFVEKENILDIYGINEQIEKISNRKIWLKCGGFITIDKTEALTAIDVNTGKYIGKNNLEETVLKVNKEASEEIAKQLKLRDIGGIIIIDYIDMKKEESKKEIIELLTSEFKKDRSKTQVIDFTKLNLLEMTRKHMFSND